VTKYTRAEVYWPIGGTYCLHLQGWIINQSSNKQEVSTEQHKHKKYTDSLPCSERDLNPLSQFSSCQKRYIYGGIWDSSDCIATGYGLDGRVSFPGRGKRFCSSPHSPERFWGHSGSRPEGTGGSFSGVKRPGCEADHSAPFSVEVKKGGAIPSLSHASSWRGE
jgi:hypothetical protein